MLSGCAHWITDNVGPVAFLLAAGVGAGLAGLATYGLFGRSGLGGVLLAVLGAIAATGLGSGLAGMMLLPLQDFELVLAALVFSAISPIVVIWGVAMAIVHWATGRNRARMSVSG
jgi:hypothetical protein